MSTKVSEVQSKEFIFNSHLVEQYLKYGSVDEVFRNKKFDLPISYAQFQRVLTKWGVVKAAGPNGKFAEVVDFLAHMAKDNIPLDKLHKKMPLNYQTSAVTLYRILSYIKEGLTRRIGAAVILTPFDNKEKILLARDYSTPRLNLGKTYGSLSLPMGYAAKTDNRKDKIVRVLQQEVFAKQTIAGKFPYDIVNNDPSPFMYLDIADVRVAVFAIQLPQDLTAIKKYSSFKLKDFAFYTSAEIINSQELDLRAGVKEAVVGYRKYLELIDRKLAINPIQAQSLLNKELATVTIELED